MTCCLFRLFILIISLIALGTSPASAQDPDSPDFQPHEYGLDPTPLVNDTLGLEMYLPTNTDTAVAYIGTGMTLTMTDGQSGDLPPSWSIRVQNMTMRNLEDPSPAGVVGQLLKQYRRGGADIEVLSNESLQLGDKIGQLVFISVNDAIGGFLIASTGEERYLIFRITASDLVATNASEYSQMRTQLDPSLRTVRLNSAHELKQLREQQFANARRALDSMTPERLGELVGWSQFYRIYKPDNTGEYVTDREIGYFKLSVKEGMRGELNPERKIEDYSSGEKELGFMLFVDARYLEDISREPMITADVQIRFWLDWNKQEEAWQARVTRRQGEVAFTEAEVGIMTPPALGVQKLKVIESSVEARTRKESDWEIREPYLPQSIKYLLGQLLPRDGSVTGPMAFHYYESSVDNAHLLPMRLDEWNTEGGQWVLESQLLPDMPAIVSTFDRDGHLVKRIKGDGTITEPIELETLRSLWERKGLPTGSGKRRAGNTNTQDQPTAPTRRTPPNGRRDR